MRESIDILGARTHNLKGVDCSFPHGEFTVITGVSGSGKSSLAFDTLYAEGQRRFVESLSTYARQFIERMERPDVDAIHGVQPAIALEQKNSVRNARSTVGTATEVHDYLRLLFAKLGTLTCPDCHVPVRPETPDSAMETLEALDEGTRVMVLGPLDTVGEHLGDSLRKELIRQGYHRLWDGTGMVDLEADEEPADAHAELYVVIDRLAVHHDRLARLRTALEQAFRAGHGRARLELPDSGEHFYFSSGWICNSCQRSFTQPEPQLFSFYSPLGACPTCEGFGRVMELDLDKVLPNHNLGVEDGLIVPWNSDGNLEMYDHLRETTTEEQIPRFIPYKDFSKKQQRNLLKGVGKFCGIKGYFDWLEKRKYKVQARVMLARYRAYRSCPTCNGTRLKPEALWVKFQDKTIAELGQMPVRLLRPFFDELTLNPAEQEVAGRALENLRQRLHYLDNIGLGYLSLDRQTRTLSGGEAQRINLASALGSALTQTLYVLDEPTVGLHARDTERLIGILHRLRDLGNTVVVVEHDLDVIRSADRLLDIGPGAGEWGGEKLYEGTPKGIEKKKTATAEFFKTYTIPPVPARGRKPQGWLKIEKATGHNLKNLTVSLPLGVFLCVTGVSGSGKTTLVRDTLCAFWRRHHELAPVELEPCDAIEGLEQIDALHWVDQTPLSRSSRSNPATYVKAYDVIRKTLAATREAKALGLTPRDFSFNVEGGRCEVCKGTGSQTIDMHFMADLEVTCEACEGRRFQSRVLQLHWHGKNIDEILQLTVDEALEFFKAYPKITRALAPLIDVGLGYIRLGQSTSTLSGGEAQRLKLAVHLATLREGEGKGQLFVFDEPTTGLHPADLTRLITIFQKLVDRGCSLLVIEHNAELIAAADWIVDLGPEGGDLGGEVVVEGSLPTLLQCKKSLTARHLRERFGKAIAPAKAEK